MSGSEEKSDAALSVLQGIVMGKSGKKNCKNRAAIVY